MKRWRVTLSAWRRGSGRVTRGLGIARLSLGKLTFSFRRQPQTQASHTARSENTSGEAVCSSASAIKYVGDTQPLANVIAFALLDRQTCQKFSLILLHEAYYAHFWYKIRMIAWCQRWAVRLIRPRNKTPHQARRPRLANAQHCRHFARTARFRVSIAY